MLKQVNGDRSPVELSHVGPQVDERIDERVAQLLVGIEHGEVCCTFFEIRFALHGPEPSNAQADAPPAGGRGRAQS